MTTAKRCPDCGFSPLSPREIGLHFHGCPRLLSKKTRRRRRDKALRVLIGNREPRNRPDLKAVEQIRKQRDPGFNYTCPVCETSVLYPDTSRHHVRGLQYSGEMVRICDDCHDWIHREFSKNQLRRGEGECDTIEGLKVAYSMRREGD